VRLQLFLQAINWLKSGFVFVMLHRLLLLLNHYNLGENISFINQWITQPNISFALKADGLSMAMLLLTTVLTPIIILMTIKFKIILCVNLVYVVCNGRNILGIRWSFVLYFLGISIDSDLFSSL
jgi:NADH:ubiquinone oxidoreductase subunit 4 (subunit M)